MGLLPDDFQFSQGSLQDYVDCRRRFLLRHLRMLAWPAVQAEPADEQEVHAQQGALFHRLVEQHQRGIPAERLASMARAADQQWNDSRLSTWWQNYLRFGPSDLPAERRPELSLSAPLGRRRLLARYDLIASEPGRRAVIVDWKTGVARPARLWLTARLQTRVYRYALIEGGAALNDGRRWRPDQVEMLYWFADHPEQPERLPYSEREHEADGRYLAALVAEIEQAGEDDFFLTDDVRRCRFCPYRSLCERGVEAGDAGGAGPEETGVEEAPADWASGFDFEQAAEVAY